MLYRELYSSLILEFDRETVKGLVGRKFLYTTEDVALDPKYYQMRLNYIIWNEDNSLL